MCLRIVYASSTPKTNDLFPMVLQHPVIARVDLSVRVVKKSGACVTKAFGRPREEARAPPVVTSVRPWSPSSHTVK
nr:hypothetical protein CFP56_28483 [Quercus suber]